jgi:hypothetical protein
MPTAASVKSSPGSEPGRRAMAGATGAALVALALLSCRTPAPPPAPGPERETIVSWEISPASGYRPDTGFVTLDFLPPERLAGTHEPPPGGRLTVHLGYRNIADANTVWYRFEIFEGARNRLRLEGEEGIPNVKDHDGYWWNDLDLDLDEPVATEIRVVVTDKRIEMAYPFTLRRVVAYK